MIKKANITDAPVVAKLAICLWDSHTIEELTNDTSLRFHRSVGFKEANRIICFTKKL